MRRAILLLAGWSALPLFAQSPFRYTPIESCGPNRSPILILGTYHMSNPKLDSRNLDADDVLSQRRQNELEQLAAALARFAPAKIAVEEPYGETYWTDRYAKQREGKLAPGRNEIEQIGFRVAKLRDLARIHPIDFPMFMSGLTPSEVELKPPTAPAPPAANAEPAGEEKLSDEDRLLRSMTVAQYLARLNDDARVLNDNAGYMEMLKNADPDGVLYAAADRVSNWYKRNLRMFANVNRITDFAARDRVLLIVGSGHLRTLRQFAGDAPQYCLVDAAEYLR